MTDYLLACGYTDAEKTDIYGPFVPGEFYSRYMSYDERIHWQYLFRKDTLASITWCFGLFNRTERIPSHPFTSIDHKMEVWTYDGKFTIMRSFRTLNYFNSLRRRRIQTHALLRNIPGFTDDLVELILWKY